MAAAIVTGPGPVGGPHFDQRDAAGGHQVRKAIRPADLDEFAPRHRNAACTASKRGKCRETALLFTTSPRKPWMRWRSD